MTFKERQEGICKDCGLSEVCVWYKQNMIYKCEYLSTIIEGWKYGQEDTLVAVEDYVDRGNSTWTEEFMEGLKEHLKLK